MDFASSTRAAENKTIWIGIVANSLWSLDDLPRLWDRKENRKEQSYFKNLLRERERTDDLFVILHHLHYFSQFRKMGG